MFTSVISACACGTLSVLFANSNFALFSLFFVSVVSASFQDYVWTFLFDIGEPKGEIGGILYTQFMNYQIYHDFYRKCFMRDLKHTSLGRIEIFLNHK
jgi:hypothetical protein